VIRRARLFFFVSMLVAAVILVTNFPVGQLLHGRSTIETETAQLAALQEANKTLTSQVRALHDPSTVGEIAHEEYGLITPGERSVVVLPGVGGSRFSGPNPLANNLVPPSDLQPSDAILDPVVQGAAPQAKEPGFWHRVLANLEFWHSLF
jgi:cell division protein FtsB